MISGGITANGVNTFTDLGINFYSRPETPPPEPKVIEEEVPYMHGTYDFSAINGEPAYSRRELSYTFGFLAENTAKLDMQVTALLEFARAVWNTELYDDTVPLYYYKDVRFAGADRDFEDADGHDAIVTLRFTAHPFRVNKNTGEEVL